MIMYSIIPGNQGIVPAGSIIRGFDIAAGTKRFAFAGYLSKHDTARIHPRPIIYRIHPSQTAKLAQGERNVNGLTIWVAIIDNKRWIPAAEDGHKT
jgi:hypothetical protein